MHLLALLIAAVFSSQFVAPNEGITGLTTTLVLSQLDILMGLPAFTVTAKGRTTEVLTFNLNANAAGTGTTNASLTVKATPADNVELHEFEAGEKPVALLEVTPLYIVADVSTVVKGASPALTVTPAKPWTIAPTRTDKKVYYADLPSSPEFVLTPGTGEAWYTDMKVKFTSPDETTGITADVVRSAQEPYTYTVAAAVNLAALTTGTVTVTLLLDGLTTEHPVKPTFVIQDGFTLTPTTTPAVLTTSHTTITTLQVATNATTWENTINFRLSKEDDDTYVTGQMTKDSAVWKATGVSLAPLGDLAGEEKLLLEVSVAANIWLAITADITILNPLFTVVKPIILVSEVAALTEIKVDFDEVGFVAAAYIVITKTLDLAAVVAENDITSNANAVAGVATVTLGDEKSKLGELVGGHKFYVYASKTGYAEALLAAPVTVKIVRDVVNIVVTPPAITSAHLALATLKVVPTPATGWGNTVHYKLTKAGGDTEVTGTLGKNGANAEWNTTNVDLTPLLPWVKDDEITVQISLDEEESYLLDTGAIAVNVAEFTVDPNPILVSEVAALNKITLSFEDEALSGAGIVVLSKTLGLGAVTANDVQKSVTIAAATDLDVTLITADIEKIGPLTDNAVFYVYAAQGLVAAALAAPPVRVTVKADPIPTLIYKITPDTATLAEIDALTSITIEPLDDETLPGTIGVEISLKPTTANTDPAPLWKAGVTKHATDDKWAVTFTNAELKGIGTIVAGSTILVKVSKTNLQAELLPKWAELAVTANPSTDPKFTIDPTFVTEGALAKADSPKFTIGIVNGVDKPDKETTAKVIFKAGTKTLPVEFAPTGDAPNVKWEIAAGECDFSLLEIATFPVTGSVEFFPKSDGEAFGPTIPFTFKAKEDPEAAMGVSPLLSLLAALVFLFVKLF